jgi:dual specificity tyrosine-phosphorylation-regulated kinase 2/3/4
MANYPQLPSLQSRRRGTGGGGGGGGGMNNFGYGNYGNGAGRAPPQQKQQQYSYFQQTKGKSPYRKPSQQPFTGRALPRRVDNNGGGGGSKTYRPSAGYNQQLKNGGGYLGGSKLNSNTNKGYAGTINNNSYSVLRRPSKQHKSQGLVKQYNGASYNNDGSSAKYSNAYSTQLHIKSPVAKKVPPMAQKSSKPSTSTMSVTASASSSSTSSSSANDTIPPKPAMTVAEAMKTHSSSLTAFEQSEILKYQQIYYCGQNTSRKRQGVPHSANNNGYDDERGDYKTVANDHIDYRYEVLGQLGKGSFGTVQRVRDHKTGHVMALKMIRNKKRFHTQALVEVKLLEKLMAAPKDMRQNVVKMYSYFYFRNHLCIVFEVLSLNLYEFTKNNHFRGVSLGLVRRFAIQLLHALRLVHKHNIIHCDLKPENILLKSRKKSGITLIDFGSSCYVKEQSYTYIQSRFYRSPEVIMGFPEGYSLPIDVWSLGCILAEMLTGHPLFPGENEVEQMQCIMEVMGVPPTAMVDRCKRKRSFFHSDGRVRVQANTKGRTRRVSTSSLAKATKCSDHAFLSFMAGCLSWDPAQRLTVEQALRHPFILAGMANAGYAAPSSTTTSTSSSSSSSKSSVSSASSLASHPPSLYASAAKSKLSTNGRQEGVIINAAAASVNKSAATSMLATRPLLASAVGNTIGPSLPKVYTESI